MNKAENQNTNGSFSIEGGAHSTSYKYIPALTGSRGCCNTIRASLLKNESIVVQKHCHYDDKTTLYYSTANSLNVKNIKWVSVTEVSDFEHS